MSGRKKSLRLKNLPLMLVVIVAVGLQFERAFVKAGGLLLAGEDPDR